MSAWVLILMFANYQSMVSATVDMPTEAACRREIQRLERSPNFVRGVCINRSQ